MSDNGPNTPRIAHKWEPIEDLPSNWRDLCRPDLHAVHRQWVADRKLILDSAKLEQFQEHLHTLWAIETGIIERLYTVDRRVTIQILEAGVEALGQFRDKGLISADAETLIPDQRAALEMVMDLVGRQRELTPFDINSLHQRLTLNQPTRDVVDQFDNRSDTEWLPSEKGVWKKWPNNPLQPDGSIHEYSPPEQVDSEIDQLLAWSSAHESLNVCAEVEAAWLHHRFAQIHPFIDGNGRIARALSSAVFLKEDYLVLVVRDEEHREPYLDALRAADKGNLKPLVDLFADIQRSDLREALKTVRSLRGEDVVEAVESVATSVRQKRDTDPEGEEIPGIGGKLVDVASVRLQEVAAETRRAFETQGIVVSAHVVDDREGRPGSLWAVHIARAGSQGGNYADTDSPYRWVALSLGFPGPRARGETDWWLVVSFHAVLGRRDIYMATPFLTWPPEEEALPLTPQAPFTFPVEPASAEETEAAFRAWLDEAVAAAVRAWGSFQNL